MIVVVASLDISHFGVTPYGVSSGSLPLLKEGLEHHSAKNPARVVQELYHASMSEGTLAAMAFMIVLRSIRLTRLINVFSSESRA